MGSDKTTDWTGLIEVVTAQSVIILSVKVTMSIMQREDGAVL